MRSLGLLVAVAVLAGCSTGEIASADAGAIAPKEAAAQETTPVAVFAHRPTAGCTHDRAPSIAGPSSDAGVIGAFVCKTDADCTLHANGRCVTTTSGAVPRVCSYDLCFADSDCKHTGPSETFAVCSCGDVVEGQATRAGHYCVDSNACEVDSNCPEGSYCSPSFVKNTCKGSLVATYACRSPLECNADADCAEAGAGWYCGLSPMLGKWACIAPLACAKGGG